MGAKKIPLILVGAILIEKNLLLFYSNGDHSSKILIFFQDEEVLIYDLNFEGRGEWERHDL